MGDGSYDVTQRKKVDVHWQAPPHRDGMTTQY
jgi:hypothetical protein